jgi:hypothetical protein
MALENHRGMVKRRAGNVLLVCGCIVLAALPWISTEWVSVAAWLALGVGLVAASHLFVPFSSRLKPVHSTLLVEPEHIAHAETKKGASRI